MEATQTETKAPAARSFLKPHLQDLKRPSLEEPPYLSFCLVVRNCEKTLEATLQSLRERALDAEIVVVDTCSHDSTPEIAQRYADVYEVYRGPRGDWTEESPWVDDMAAARQRSFELASGAWRAWVDGDDRVVGGQECVDLLKLNGYYKPEPQGFSVWNPHEELQGDDGDLACLTSVLHWIEEHQPEATMLWCPYLYRKDEHGHAEEWQVRERFVRWSDPAKFRWSEEAHEVLVPVGDYRPPRVEMPSPLWVHEKDWSVAAVQYSFQRHGKILLDQYERGEVTHRRSRYLAMFSGQLWPERRLEFLQSALDHAHTPTDRARAYSALGGYYADRGLYLDSKGYHAAALEACPELPELWFAAGLQAHQQQDYPRAIDMLRKACRLQPPPQSEASPRDLRLKVPSLLSVVLQEAAQESLSAAYQRSLSEKELEHVLLLLNEAQELAQQVLGRPEVGEHDGIEATALYARARNACNAHRAVMCLRETWLHLRQNDEPLKAAALFRLAPWSQEDHPAVLEMERWSRPILRHACDPKAYRAFYSADMETGYVPMPDEAYLPDNAQARTKWAVDWVKDHRPLARVLDLGCCDGVQGVPMLLSCPEVSYYGVDVNQSALDQFSRLLEVHGVETQLRPVSLGQGEWPGLPGPAFGVVLAGEVLEHVPDPLTWLCQVKSYLATDGVVLLTTPWGSFDEGLPPERTAYGTPRDERGHLRAFSPREACDVVRDAGLVVEELVRQGDPAARGHAMLLRARRPTVERSKGARRPVATVVSGSLWNWNGSTVQREGIGASEEMIVRLSEALSADRAADVYGPCPEAEVWKGVGYWPRSQVRRIPKEAKLLVSRSPSWVRQVDELVGREQPAVLWLQDTYYPDLTAEVASRYERIVCVSEWHREFTAQHHDVELDKIDVAHNFLLAEEFQPGVQACWEGLKEESHFIWASSPDRGLVRLLELWPKIRAAIPGATLSVFYGWKGAKRLGQGVDPTWVKRYHDHRRAYERLRHQEGVTEVGLVNHARIALEFQRAGVWAYPCGPFAETFCTNAIKARAAGAVPVTDAWAALNETAACPQASLLEVGEDGTHPEGYDDLFVQACVEAWQTSTEERLAMASQAIREHRIEARLPFWNRVLS